MPLVPLAPDNTKRYYLDYTHAGVEHTMVVRTNQSVTDSAVVSQIDAFLTDISTLIQTIEITGFRKSEILSNVTNPVTWTGAASYSVIAAQAVSRPNFLSWTGRSPAGYRARITVFGRNTSPTDNYRITTSESAPVANAIDQLELVPGIFLAIDGDEPVWNPYANAGSNSYWQRKVRTL